MYCPKCGNENSEKQKFCRSCGLKLKMISAVLATQVSTERSDREAAATCGGQPRGWQNPLVLGFLLLMLGTLIAVFGKKLLVDKTIADMGVIGALVGIGLIGWKGVMLMLPQSRQVREPESMPREELSASATPALRSAEAPSITEHTTRQLEPSIESNEARPRTTQPTS